MLLFTSFSLHHLLFTLVSLYPDQKENQLTPTSIQAGMGTSRPCRSLKSLSNKFGGILRFCHSRNRFERLDNKLEKKMKEVKQSSTPGNSNIRSINSIILRFPHFREGLQEIRDVFRQYDADANGTINREELRKCLQELQFECTEQEIDDLFESGDLSGKKGMKLNEFIVVLCLIYLLMGTSSSHHTATKMGSPVLKATFDTIIEAFLYLDKNGDGKLNKKDINKAMNDHFHFEKSPIHITITRFKEMDWNKDGKVGFREFLFSLINWIGIDSNEEVNIIEI